MNATCLVSQNMFKVEGVSDVALQHLRKTHLMPVKDNIKYWLNFFFSFFFVYVTLTELKSIFSLKLTFIWKSRRELEAEVQQAVLETLIDFL